MFWSHVTSVFQVLSLSLSRAVWQVGESPGNEVDKWPNQSHPSCILQWCSGCRFSPSQHLIGRPFVGNAEARKTVAKGLWLNKTENYDGLCGGLLLVYPDCFRSFNISLKGNRKGPLCTMQSCFVFKKGTTKETETKYFFGERFNLILKNTFSVPGQSTCSSCSQKRKWAIRKRVRRSEKATA